ncbi:MAG: hypothetical protein EAZ97_01760 [Bacteroidetes bacterium]|nr:MAG: hypothetical protein EAZ97_01760 [Bacteroidota bacterium]
MPKFDLELKDCRNLTDKWIYFIKNAENLEVTPKNLKDKGLKSAYQEANKHLWTKEELDAYDYVYMRSADEEAKWLKVIRKEKEKGKIEGKSEGKLEEKLEIAKNAILGGLPDALIAQITGLSLEEIKNLKENINP